MYDKVQSKIEDSGVSPVIGVILMVAVTVALVALVTVIVFDIGGDVSESPDATVNLENDSGDVKATVLRNENVESFRLEAQTEGGSTQTQSFSNADAGTVASLSSAGTTQSVNDEEIDFSEFDSSPPTTGDTAPLDNSDATNLVLVEQDTTDDNSPDTDVTSEYAIAGGSNGQLEFTGSGETDGSSTADLYVDYEYTSGSVTYTKATVIATMSDGSEQVLTSTDF